VGTGGGPALGNSGAYFITDAFDKEYGAVAFDDNSDVLTGGDLINGGATVAPTADETASGSVSLLFRTLGALTANKRYLLSQGTSSTGSKNAFHVYFDNTAGGQGLKLQIGDTTTEILPASQIVFSAWYYLAITWKHDRNPEVIWYLSRVGGVLNSGSIDLQDLPNQNPPVYAVVGDNGPLHLGNGTASSVILNATVNGTFQSVTIYQNGDPIWNNANWKTTTFYFKAGSYYPTAPNSGTAKVTFSSLAVTPQP
jgi:hypothetical protein